MSDIKAVDFVKVKEAMDSELSDNTNMYEFASNFLMSVLWQLAAQNAYNDKKLRIVPLVDHLLYSDDVQELKARKEWHKQGNDSLEFDPYDYEICHKNIVDYLEEFLMDHYLTKTIIVPHNTNN